MRIGMRISCAPEPSISSRTMRSILRIVRRPSGSIVYTPAISWRMYAARRSRRCEGASASLGSSRSVRANSLDILMDDPGYRPPVLARGGRNSAADQVHRLLPVLGGAGTVRLRVLVHHGHHGGVDGITTDRVEI